MPFPFRECASLPLGREVAETIFEFIGSDDQFEQARLRARQTYTKCESARLALEAHLERHNCGLSSLETTNP